MSYDAVRAIAITAKSGSTCTANVAGIVTTIEVARDLTVAAGDALLVLKYGGRSQWCAIARLSTAAPADPVDPVPPPPAPAAPQHGVLSVSAYQTGSYRSGGWRTDNDDVYQGQYGGQGNHTGAVFYGTKPRSLEGASVVRATIRVWRPDVGGANSAQSTTMRLVTQNKRPGGAPTMTSSTSGPSLRRGQTVGAFEIPASWAQAMVDGTAGGLGFFDASGSPYVILAGRGRSSASFTLAIQWTR
jgi:hypothetical protein